MRATKSDLYEAAANAGFSLDENEYGNVIVFTLQSGSVRFTASSISETMAFIAGYVACLTKK